MKRNFTAYLLILVVLIISLLYVFLTPTLREVSHNVIEASLATETSVEDIPSIEEPTEEISNTEASTEVYISEREIEVGEDLGEGAPNEEFNDRPSHEPEYEIGDKVNGGTVTGFDDMNDPIIKSDSFKVTSTKLEDFLKLFIPDYTLGDYGMEDIEETESGFSGYALVDDFNCRVHITEENGIFSFEMEQRNPVTGYIGLYSNGYDLDVSAIEVIENSINGLRGLFTVMSMDDTSVTVTCLTNNETRVIRLN